MCFLFFKKKFRFSFLISREANMSEARMIEMFDKLSVKELQEICRRFDLPYSGVKKFELIQRVVNFLHFIDSIDSNQQSGELSNSNYETPRRTIIKGVFKRFILKPVCCLSNVFSSFRPLTDHVNPTSGYSESILLYSRRFFDRISTLVSLFGGIFAMYQLWLRIFGEEKFIVYSHSWF